MFSENSKELIKLWEINHLLTCLAEECGEVMELLYLDPSNKEKIEQELNDIIAVAHILYDKDIICANFEPKKILPDNIKEAIHPIFECIKNIQYFTHKSIRFGLLDSKPNSKRRNIDELKYLLNSLSSIIFSSNNYELWESHNAKIVKVFKYLDYAKKNVLNTYDNIVASKDF